MDYKLHKKSEPCLKGDEPCQKFEALTVLLFSEFFSI